MKNKTALITGGSSGIGFALANLFAKDGYDLIIVSLPQDELDRAKMHFEKNYKDINVTTYQKDLSVQGSAKQVYDFVDKMGVKLDVLVNNAGYACYGDFNKINLDRELSMLNLCSITLYEMTRLFVNDMIERDSGRIMNVASMIAYQPVPYCAAYSGVKAFVYYYSRAINYELQDKGSNVTVTVLCPPATKSGFAKAAKMTDSPLYKNDKKGVVFTSEEVAAEAYEALMQGKAEIVPGKGMETSVKLMNRLLPLNKIMGLMKKQIL